MEKFGIFHGRLVDFCSYLVWTFQLFWCRLVYCSHFGILHQGISGNPDFNPFVYFVVAWCIYSRFWYKLYQGKSGNPVFNPLSPVWFGSPRRHDNFAVFSFACDQIWQNFAIWEKKRFKLIFETVLSDQYIVLRKYKLA
jgi:hypothetical protein